MHGLPIFSCMADSKNFYQHMFVYYSLLLPQHNLDFIMFKIQLPVVQKFNQNVVARCLPLNFKHAYQSGFICPSSFSLSKTNLKKNVLHIAIITFLCWSKYIPNLIILMSMHFLPTQIYNHCLPTCSFCVLLIRSMNSLWNLFLSMLLLM